MTDSARFLLSYDWQGILCKEVKFEISLCISSIHFKNEPVWKVLQEVIGISWRQIIACRCYAQLGGRGIALACSIFFFLNVPHSSYVSADKPHCYRNSQSRAVIQTIPVWVNVLLPLTLKCWMWAEVARFLGHCITIRGLKNMPSRPTGYPSREGECRKTLRNESPD